MYVDCDEFVVIDPRVSPSLSEYFSGLDQDEMVSAIGYNILHNFDYEPPIKHGEKITESRSCLQLTSSMCKSVAVSSGAEARRSCGFHFSSMYPRFGDLFLFHTRYVDLNSGLKRLAFTRSISDQPRLMLASHQRISDKIYIQWLKDMLSHPIDREDISMCNQRINNFFSELPIELSRDGFWEFPLNLSMKLVNVLPERFVGLF
jgi:hypothetical protein